MKNKIILILIIVIVSSCSNNDDPGIAGLNDYSGKFRLSFVNDLTACTNSSINNSISSEDDLEINKNGRFKRKIYSLNSNNECVVKEVIEGKITIKSSSYLNPVGIMEYDNSRNTDELYIRESLNGKHNEITIYEKNPNRPPTTYSYGRSD